MSFNVEKPCIFGVSFERKLLEFRGMSSPCLKIFDFEIHRSPRILNKRLVA
jgi:hypothetical protein